MDSGHLKKNFRGERDVLLPHCCPTGHNHWDIGCIRLCFLCGLQWRNGTALRLCLDRIIPPRRERPARFEMPVLQSPADAVAAMAAIAAAVAQAHLTPGEAAELSNMVGNYVKSLEAAEFDER
jgi:hypothetical protein